MTAQSVVIVESPAKAKTINKYLGSGYQVLASYGHVRDLPSKNGSVDPADDFAMQWEVDTKAKKRIADIATAVKGAERLILATDPDREGEAISWHVLELLTKKKVLKDVEVAGVVLHENTKNAVLDAMSHPRPLNQELIDAYLARRALDYLVGFTISPVLWRKLPGARSAGRVQSVALRLVCEREAEIEIFKPQEFWTVEGWLRTAAGEDFTARLTHLDGKKLDKFALADEDAARFAVSKVEGAALTVLQVERKTVRRNPSPPFTTSTLQQEASRKLGFGTSRTMQIAQKLYEGFEIDGESVGLITYMRTDSVTLSKDAIEACRRLIPEDYGKAYLPDTPRVYKTKAKNAQEAHEGIRPTDLFLRPASLKAILDDDTYKLYELIWKRTVASEMESAALDQVAVDLAPSDGACQLRANGSVVKFDGFMKLYEETGDDNGDKDGKDRRLPDMAEGQAATTRKVAAEQHFTQPPPRYSEASLVKKMEELGIGRPSTYASILKVLQDRGYVRLDKRRFVPEDKGRLVTTFLSSFFKTYVEYGFTAEMEERLDDVSGGRVDWKDILRDFWGPFHERTEQALTLTGTEVRDTIDRDLGPHFFQPDEDGNTEAARACPACKDGRLSLNFGKWGAFIACSGYPECRYTRALSVSNDDESQADAEMTYPVVLGPDPATLQDITLRKGPYGVYVQLGEAPPKEKGKKAPPKPKRASLLKGMRPSEITLGLALKLLSLPRELGTHPESGDPILAGVGRFGPYLKHGSAYTKLPAEDDVLTIGMNRAVEVIANAPKKRGSATAGKTIGEHPDDGKPVTVQNGRYGPYVKHGRINATLPKDMEMDSVTLEQAVELLAAKASKSGATKKPAASKSKSAKSGTRKKAAAKKAASGG